MTMIVSSYYGKVHIPSGINDLAAFRRWVHSASLPEKLPIHFLQGEVWADFTKPESLTNVMICGELSATLHGLVKEARSGWFATAGMLWSNDDAGFATLPDGLFISREALSTGRVLFSNGGNPKAKATEIIGTPDIVIEIVSDVSEEKDTEWCMSAYFDAGITEFWVIDARDDIRFDIYKRSKKEFTAVRRQAGCIKSSVLGKAFRLVQTEDDEGKPEFTLEVR